MLKRINIAAIVLFLLAFGSQALYAEENSGTEKFKEQKSSAKDPSSLANKENKNKNEKLSLNDGMLAPKALFEDKAFQSVEKLNVDPATGTATAGISIYVPSGRAGIQPSIALSYNSSSPNGIAGMGWSLEFGKVSRSTKYGVPTYTNADRFVLAQSGSRQDLVDVSGNATLFRPEIEGAFMKIEFLNNGYWRMMDKKGICYYFGQSTASQVVDPNNNANVFEWYLDRVEDIYGNFMTLSYVKDQNQIYPSQIFYTGNSQGNLQPFAMVQFEFEGRPDTMFSYISHFLVRTAKRLSAVKVFAQGALQRKYTFSYDQSPVTQRSLLVSVTQYGADGISSLPTTTFRYQQSIKGFQAATGWTIPANARFAEYQQGGRYADLGVRIADVNGDGYPDILKYHEYHWGSPTRETFLHDKHQGWVASPSDWKFPEDLRNFLATAPEIDRGFGVCLADVNGDGWMDLVRHFQAHPPAAGGTITNQAFINNHQNGWTYDASWQLPQDGVLPISWELGQPVYSYHEYTGNLLDDVNGDGFVDYVKSKSDGWGPHTHMTFINNKPVTDGYTYDSAWNTQDSIYMDFAHGAILVDLNGDNLKDIMYSKDGTKKVFINNGTTWVEDSSSPWLNEYGYTNFNDGSTQCADINGDNMPDLIVSDDNSQKVLLNNGHGWTVDNTWVIPGNLKSNGAKLLDADADGLLDVIKHFNGNTPELYLNRGNVPDLLVLMDNGIGAVKTIVYDSACHYDNSFFPFAVPVVKSLTVRNGVTDFYTTTYAYANGMWNAEKRESRGFGYVKVIDADGNYSETVMLQDDIFKGRPSEQRTYDANGKLYAKTQNTWDSQELESGVHFVYLKQKDDFVYNGEPSGKRTQEKYFYEELPQFGNLTQAVQLGEVDFNTGNDIGSDSRTAETQYHNNTETGHWILGLPKQTVVYDHNNNVVRKAWIYYDGNDDLNALPALGQMTKQEKWAGGTPGSTNPTIEYTYDPYGNLLTTKDPNGHITTVTYENQYFIFPIEVKNALDQKAEKEYYGVNGVPLNGGNGYRGLWGQVKSVKDPNDQEGKKTYDTFGRLIATVSPLDSISFPTTSMEYKFENNYVQVITHQREISGQYWTMDTAQFYDGLGRLIFTKSKSGYADKTIVSGIVKYDQRGLPIEKHLPFFSKSLITDFSNAPSTNPKTTLVYDAMGRVIKTINPNGTYATAEYGNWVTATIDENGHKQASYTDAYGRLVTRDEYFGADGRSDIYPQEPFSLYATTNYFYDSEGNLTQVQDAHGNVTTISYDTLGRKVSMDDPDMGHWEYKYDAVGNLVWQRDAKGQELTFSYDALNRLVNKTDGSPILNVAYTYDQEFPAPPQNYGIGRLLRSEYGVNDQTGFLYDLLGREIRSTKEIDSKKYDVLREYDAASRLTKLTYPDSGNVIYTYNVAGQIDGVGTTSGNSDVSYKEDPGIVHKKNSLALTDKKSISRKEKFDTSAVPSFASMQNETPVSSSNPDSGETVGISVTPVQPVQLVRMDYTIDLTWSGVGNSGQYKLFTILIEMDTGVYLAGAHNCGGTPPGPWVGDSIDVTPGSGSATLVKDLEAYQILLGQVITNYMWIAELRLVTPGYTYDPNNHMTFSTVARMDINTTAGTSASAAIHVEPDMPHPAVIANYNVDVSWDNLPQSFGYDYKLFYILVEGVTGYYFSGAQDPDTGIYWTGMDVDIDDTSPSGSYSGAKELIAYDTIWGGMPILVYDWIAQIRRVVPGKIYNSADPTTFITVAEDIIQAKPGTGLRLSLSVNYFRPILNYTKEYVFDLSWLDPIPTFDNTKYDYKYFITIVDADSRFPAAMDENGQWWSQEADITDGAPSTVSIVKRLKVVNSDGGNTNTNRFAWIGEIRRYPKGNTTDHIVVSRIREEVFGKDLGSYVYVANVQYNAAGQIIEIEYGNNTKTTYRYNPDTLRLERMVTFDAQGQALQDFSYGYDEAGNIIKIEDSVNTASQQFIYDALNRLVQANGQYGTKVFAYDEIGNILEKDGLSYTYGENGAGPHAVTSLSDGTTFKYDENGNMMAIHRSDQKWAYVFDSENRLTEVSKNDKAVARFEYDGDGGRVKKTFFGAKDATGQSSSAKQGIFDLGRFSRNNKKIVDGLGGGETTTRFIGSLYDETSGIGGRYVFLGSMRVAEVRGGVAMYYLTDHLGGTNLLTDEKGLVKELCEYLPFGGFSRHEKFGAPQETAWFYFTGKQLDEETGLYYYGARYYNPLIGRFITPDTIVQAPNNPQTLNRYTYCNNNPVNLIDPTGHSWWKKFWKGFTQNVLPHLFNAVRVVFDIMTFPVNPVGSTLDMASVIAGYTGGGDSRKISNILGWTAIGWNVGQGIYNALDPSEVQLINAEGKVVTDYSKVNRVLSTGVNTTSRDAIRTLERANKNLTVKYDAIIWNKTHGPLSDFIESGVAKFTGSRTLANEYSKIINNVVSANPAAFDVHSEATILFTRAFRSLPADSLSQSTVNFFGTAVLESTARNSFLIPGGSTGALTFDSSFSDPITSFFGTLNPARMAIGGGIGVATGGALHNIYGYLSQRYPGQ